MRDSRTVGRERDLYLQKAETDNACRHFLTDLRIISKIPALPESMEGKRDANGFPGEEISIANRMASCVADFPCVSGILVPYREMAYFPSIEIAHRRTSRPPPFAPYVIPDSLDETHCLPTGDPPNRSMDRWNAIRLKYRRFVGNQDLAIGQFVSYRMRFTIAGDLTGAWADFGWIGSRINHLDTALSISIAGHAGVDLIYDYTQQRTIQKLAKTPPRTGGLCGNYGRRP